MTPLADQFRFWARVATEDVDSPLYAHLFGRIALDLDAGGILRDVLDPFEYEPASHVMPVRLAFQVHRWVLRGEVPALAAYYRSAGGQLPPVGSWPVFRDVCEARSQELQQLLTEPCQTNQVGRSAALLGGFDLVARETGMPLRLLEIGTGAGLLLRTDHYRGAWWMAGMFDVPPPPGGDMQVVQRRGCDPAPIDPGSRDGELRLRACVWPDREDELLMLGHAIAVCRRVPAEVAQADGADWLPAQLEPSAPGVATVVFHSVTTMYLSMDSRRRMEAALRRAASAATGEAPVAWLRFEPAPGWREGLEAPDMEVRLSLWPGGDDQLLATADCNGSHVRWVGGA